MNRVGSGSAFLARLVGAALAVAAGVVTVDLAEGPARSITDAGRSTSAAVLTLAVGLALVAAALTLLFARRPGRTTDVLLLAAITWYAPVWVGWTEGPPTVRSVAALLPGFTLPLLLHATLGRPTGWVRALVALAYGEAVLAAGALALFRDPYFDPSCWANCSVNTLLVTSHASLVHGAEVADRWFVAAVAVAFCAISVARLVSASRPALTRLAPTYLPAIVFAATLVTRAVALQHNGVDDPFDDALAVTFEVTSWALIALAAGFVWSVVRGEAERRAVAQIAAKLDEAPAPGTVREALAVALRDPALQVAYWLPHEQRYVNADGAQLPEPAARPGCVLTRLTRNGHTVAVMEHTAATADTLAGQIGPSLRLGLENERLQAEVLARLAELRASRARIVETADRERRHLERDLHDGAQQHLLALSYEVRLAHASARRDGDVGTASVLAVAIRQTQAALDELRDLAHGIYPAVLSDAGLRPALETLADTAPLRVEIKPMEARRYAPAVETAVYVAVAEAIECAALRGAAHADVTVTRDEGSLVVTVRDDGPDGRRQLVSLADRVGALGGSLAVTQTECRAAIPCG
jgi:signal transduction histidine kinase